MKKKWWHDKIAYQIYPKSFCDSNGDGVGDIQGVISKLDYIKALGIDIIWLSPIYKSPFVDQGYDISDYYAIAEQFGTMGDFERLLSETKKRQMYVVMDLVINHCSDQHPWFQKALQNPEGEYADYFYFRKGKGENPPSNYRSYFGGNAWEKIEGTDYYYLHLFAKEQPDLNWENQKVRDEIYTMINWWLEKGIAGFRIDAIINIKKDPAFPCMEADGPDGLVFAGKMIESVQGIGELLEEVKHHTFEKYDAFTVAEVFNMRKEELIEFIGENGHFSTMFDFAGEIACAGAHGWYDAGEFSFVKWRNALLESQVKCYDVGFLANIIENHDEPRGAYRFLPKHLRNAMGAKMLGAISLLFRGIPFIYQGQEIGMTNCRMSSIEEYDDISTKNEYQVALNAGLTKEEALEVCFEHSRDNARTPMQWNASKNAGFTDGIPWMRVNSNYQELNVEAQEKDKDSVLNFYRSLVALRKMPEYKECLVYGETIPMYVDNQNLFAYKRKDAQNEIWVVANFGKETETFKTDCKVILLSNGKVKRKNNQYSLDPGEVIILEM